MGWAARQNPKSDWNKKRMTAVVSEPSKVVTSQNTAVKVQTPRNADEPIVIELSISNIMGLLRSWLKSLKHRPNHAPIS